MAGIRTIADIKDRCVIDDITGCWNWAGARNDSGTPVLWFPELRKRISIGIALCVLTTGERPAKGKMWLPVCRNQCCGNPEHRKPGTAKQRSSKAKKSPAHTAKMTAAVRRRSKVTEEIVAAIRASDRTLAEESAIHGISASQAGRIRRWDNWRPVCVNSVFNLGG